MSFISDFFYESRQKPKRNYIKENIKKLQEIGKPKQPDTGASRFGSFNKRPLSELNDRIGIGYQLQKSGSNVSLDQAKVKDVPHPTGFRHQSCQTVSEKDLDSLYHEGVIRFPSKVLSNVEQRSHTKMVRTISLQTEVPLIRARSLTPPKITGSPAGGDTIKDFVKLNAMVQVNPVRRRRSSPSDPIRPPPNYQMGMLPKYLREQKKEQEKMKDFMPSSDPECPPGHTVLPEEERIKHLGELKLRYTDLISQLNSLPVKTDTLRTRKRRMQIEKELEKTEAGIKLFSRDKLFIQVAS